MAKKVHLEPVLIIGIKKKQDQNNYLGKWDFPLVKDWDWEKLGF